MEIWQIGIYILKTRAVQGLDASLLICFIMSMNFSCMYGGELSHLAARGSLWIYLSPDWVNSKSFWVKFSIIWHFHIDSFTSFIFKHQCCGQVTWPQPISSHWKERERKMALNPVWSVGTSVKTFLWSTQTPLRSSSRPAPPAPSCCLWRATRPWTPPASPWPPTGDSLSMLQSWESRPSRELRRRFDAGSRKDKPFLSYLTLWQEHQPHIFPSVESAIFPSYVCIFKAVPEKSSFVEYTVQECPEGLTERGTCQQPTLDSDTEVTKTIKRVLSRLKWSTSLNHFTLKTFSTGGLKTAYNLNGSANAIHSGKNWLLCWQCHTFMS